MLSFFRRIIDLAWFKGPIHKPKPGGHYSDWRNALANCFEFIRIDILSLNYMRDPDRTPRLSDLEKEFGINTDENLSEETRIDLLKTRRYRKDSNAQDDDLQDLLDKGGFDLFVYNNGPTGPAIDPAIILDSLFVMQAEEGTNYYAGNDDAYAGRDGGDLLANGPTFEQEEGILGAGNLFAGNTVANAGFFARLVQTPVVYPIPTDSKSWPFVFFVGGAAVLDGAGSIVSIAQGQVPREQRDRLEEIILGFKPLFSWAGLVITFT